MASSQGAGKDFERHPGKARYPLKGMVPRNPLSGGEHHVSHRVVQPRKRQHTQKQPSTLELYGKPDGGPGTPKGMLPLKGMLPQKGMLPTKGMLLPKGMLSPKGLYPQKGMLLPKGKVPPKGTKKEDGTLHEDGESLEEKTLTREKHQTNGKVHPQRGRGKTEG
ncbi:hypothetical protein E2C01_062132 [Portunus trituberculatus]|uniref:Uncharacterized protein n=1 Tax=Portunus trituberculatus TaxID=210409 RepID=A0A5B7HEA3_PORTR|nr:hypothetical protein [Portunus trituberculatus]